MKDKSVEKVHFVDNSTTNNVDKYQVYFPLKIKINRQHWNHGNEVIFLGHIGNDCLDEGLCLENVFLTQDIHNFRLNFHSLPLGNIIIIGSGNGLSFIWWQANARINAELLSFKHLGTCKIFQENISKMISAIINQVCLDLAMGVLQLINDKLVMI